MNPPQSIETDPRTFFVACDSMLRPPRILSALVLAYVALLPYQFEVANRMNFAPADCLMLLVLLLAAGQLKYRKPAWTIWHFGIPLIFAAGSLVAALRFGVLDRYELYNKDAGLVLPFLSYAAITSAITDWDDVRRILRVFTLSVVLENIRGGRSFLVVLLCRRVEPLRALRRAASVRDAAGSERLWRPSGGRIRDLRRCVAGAGALSLRDQRSGSRGSPCCWEFYLPSRAPPGWRWDWRSCFSVRCKSARRCGLSWQD